MQVLKVNAKLNVKVAKAQVNLKHQMKLFLRASFRLLPSKPAWASGFHAQ